MRLFLILKVSLEKVASSRAGFEIFMKHDQSLNNGVHITTKRTRVTRLRIYYLHSL